jgi:hypothetical protein
MNAVADNSVIVPDRELEERGTPTPIPFLDPAIPDRNPAATLVYSAPAVVVQPGCTNLNLCSLPLFQADDDAYMCCSEGLGKLESKPSASGACTRNLS